MAALICSMLVKFTQGGFDKWYRAELCSIRAALPVLAKGLPWVSREVERTECGCGKGCSTNARLKLWGSIYQ